MQMALAQVVEVILQREVERRPEGEAQQPLQLAKSHSLNDSAMEGSLTLDPTAEGKHFVRKLEGAASAPSLFGS